MRHRWITVCGSIVVSTLAACGSHDDRSALRHFSVVDTSHIAVHASGAPDAVVASDGALLIDGTAQVVTPAQQILLEDLYTAVVSLRNDAAATGLAGAATARQAIGSVVSGLGTGDADRIGAEIDVKAALVEQRAGKVCADLGAIRAKEDAIVAQIAAFRPYAQAERNDDCATH